MEYKGKEYLQRKLAMYRSNVNMLYEYYAMKNQDASNSITMPESIRNMYKCVLGWAAKSVDSLADRLVVREFVNDNFGVNEIFRYNNPDIFFDSVVLSALIGSCCFVYIS